LSEAATIEVIETPAISSLAQALSTIAHSFFKKIGSIITKLFLAIQLSELTV
jgi:hypothetical protein